MVNPIAPELLRHFHDLYAALPGVPGKLAVILLALFLSGIVIVAVYRHIYLKRVRKADRELIRELKQSRTRLEIYEANRDFAPSAFFYIYEAAARASAIEMIGAGFVPQRSLNNVQIANLKRALDEGEQEAAYQLEFRGTTFLRLCSFASLATGISAAVYIMLTPLWDTVLLRTVIGSGMFILAGAALVTMTAESSRSNVLLETEKYTKRLQRFKRGIFSAFANGQPSADAPPTR